MSLSDLSNLSRLSESKPKTVDSFAAVDNEKQRQPSQTCQPRDNSFKTLQSVAGPPEVSDSDSEGKSPGLKADTQTRRASLTSTSGHDQATTPLGFDRDFNAVASFQNESAQMDLVKALDKPLGESLVKREDTTVEDFATPTNHLNTEVALRGFSNLPYGDPQPEPSLSSTRSSTSNTEMIPHRPSELLRENSQPEPPVPDCSNDAFPTQSGSTQIAGTTSDEALSRTEEPVVAQQDHHSFAVVPTLNATRRKRQREESNADSDASGSKRTRSNVSSTCQSPAPAANTPMGSMATTLSAAPATPGLQVLSTPQPPAATSNAPVELMTTTSSATPEISSLSVSQTTVCQGMLCNVNITNPTRPANVPLCWKCLGHYDIHERGLDWRAAKKTALRKHIVNLKDSNMLVLGSRRAILPPSVVLSMHLLEYAKSNLSPLDAGRILIWLQPIQFILGSPMRVPLGFIYPGFEHYTGEGFIAVPADVKNLDPVALHLFERMYSGRNASYGSDVLAAPP